MEPYEGIDFYEIDALLSPEERMIRDTVRRWVERRVVPEIGSWTEQATFPRHLVSEMGDLGILGPNIPGEGSPELGAVGYGLIQQELERGDSGLRSFASVQGSLVMHPIHTYGSDEQKRRWLPLLRSGAAIGCYGLTEPDAGSNPGAMRTVARRDGDGWVLNGAKMWITNGSIADVAVVFAKADETIRGFLVEAGTPGYSTVETKHKWSLRASVTSELLFEDCRIPAGAALPGALGLKTALDCLTQARYGIAWGAVGAAGACYHEALRHAKTRVQFDGPIAGHQLVQRKLVEMVSEITKGQLLAYRLGRLKEEGKAKFYHVSLAKRDNVRMALQVARDARDLLGASGITLEHASGRHMANLESVHTYEGTHDIHTLIIGSVLTGIEAYR
ncbi:MAG: acyl-CoA dehydrogenase [Candidatus Eisenbacteria bacterium]|nr:acyl-CoA dehydrogenase [Candidatus Latescibacterota bacterium]MBD3300826.1 acyl-CoA dehydrogenase [Candidatus Eisenbacteria bacterium]